MNFGLVTLIFFIALIPGFSFFASFHRGNVSRKNNRTSVFRYVYESMTPALVIHLIFILLINSEVNQISPKVNIEFLGTMLSGNNEIDNFGYMFKLYVGDQLPFILLYLFLTFIIGTFLGYFLRAIIRFFEIDIRFPYLFRFDNEWFYAFNGEIFSSKSLLGYQQYKSQYPNRDQLTLIADVLCDISTQPVIYNGIVAKYFLDKDGLDTLYLKEAQRKLFNAERTSKKIISKMKPNIQKGYLTNDSSVIVIPNANIHNIRVSILNYENEINKNIKETEKLISQVINDLKNSLPESITKPL